MSIKQCNCKHKYQDKKYGTNMRVHNKCKSSHMGKVEYRCTVCGSVK